MFRSSSAASRPQISVNHILSRLRSSLRELTRSVSPPHLSTLWNKARHRSTDRSVWSSTATPMVAAACATSLSGRPLSRRMTCTHSTCPVREASPSSRSTSASDRKVLKRLTMSASSIAARKAPAASRSRSAAALDMGLNTSDAAVTP